MRPTVGDRVLSALAAAAPEGCAEGSRFLTVAGWVEVSAAPEFGGATCSVHCKFQIPCLMAGRVIGGNRLSGKWNHCPAVDEAEEAIIRLFARLWPSPEGLAEAQFLGAMGDVFAARRAWAWDQVLFGPLAGRKRLPILSPRQPGRHDRAATLGRSYAEEDEEAFRAVCAEFPRCPTVALDPDPRPGAYYVSAVDGARRWLLAGPWPFHGAALSQVDSVRRFASEADPRGSFVAYGTARRERPDLPSRLGSDPAAWAGPRLPPSPSGRRPSPPRAG